MPIESIVAAAIIQTPSECLGAEHTSNSMHPLESCQAREYLQVLRYQANQSPWELCNVRYINVGL